MRNFSLTTICRLKGAKSRARQCQMFYKNMVEREGQAYVDAIFSDKLRITKMNRAFLEEKIEEYRDKYGHFYYRFRDGGESCADVFDRVSDFMNTMFRDFNKSDFPRNVVVVTHGMTMRLFIMRWFHCSVEEFESWANIKNCHYLLLERGENEKYELKTPLRKHKIRHDFQFPFENYDPAIFPYPHDLPYEPQSR